MTGPLSTLLVLADSRLPAGGHAYSGGLEPAVAAGRVRDLADLAGFLRGRLATAGLVAAAFAAAACASASTHSPPSPEPEPAILGHLSRAPEPAAAPRPPGLAELDAGLDARTASPAARRASRAQGRGLLRAGRALWPGNPEPAGAPVELALTSAAFRPDPHYPVALGLVAAAAGLTPAQVAPVAAYGCVAGPASAAVRLLGLDPYRVHALLATLAPVCDEVAAAATAAAGDPVSALPASAGPLLDLSAEVHATWEVRLFAS